MKHERLGCDVLRTSRNLAQRPRRDLVQLAPVAQQQRLVTRLLHERLHEHAHQPRRRCHQAHDSISREVLQDRAGFPQSARLPQALRRRDVELDALHRAVPEQLALLLWQPIQPAHHRRAQRGWQLQRLRGWGECPRPLLAQRQFPRLDERPHDLLQKERHPRRAAQHLLPENIGRMHAVHECRQQRAGGLLAERIEHEHRPGVEWHRACAGACRGDHRQRPVAADGRLEQGGGCFVHMLVGIEEKHRIWKTRRERIEESEHAALDRAPEGERVVGRFRDGETARRDEIPKRLPVSLQPRMQPLQRRLERLRRADRLAEQLVERGIDHPPHEPERTAADRRRREDMDELFLRQTRERLTHETRLPRAHLAADLDPAPLPGDPLAQQRQLLRPADQWRRRHLRDP